MTSSVPRSRSERIYGRLLRIYPAPFRRECGPAMVDLFRDRYRNERRARGRWGVLALWGRVLADLTVSAGAEWWVHGQARSPQSPPRSRRTLIRQHLRGDVRHALRALIRSPGFTAIAVASLALGIGANTVIFSIVDRTILNPLPYPDPETLVVLEASYPRLQGDAQFFNSGPEYALIRDQSRTLKRFFAYDLGNRNLTGLDQPTRLFTALIWGDPFSTLDMQPALGRGFLPEELSRDSRVAILSHRAWAGMLGGDTAMVGRPIIVNGSPYTLIGVLPADLSVAGTDLWIPVTVGPDQAPLGARQYTVMARRSSGVELAEVNVELGELARRIADRHLREAAEYEGWTLAAVPAAEAQASRIRSAGLIIMSAVGLVLLIACANIANLLLARATTRRRELAVRAALGAGRVHIVTLLLIDSLVLAGLGGLLALVGAYAALDVVVGALPPQITGGVHFGLDARALVFTAGLSVGCGVLFGLVPAIQASTPRLQEALGAESSRVGRSARAGLLRQGLVVTEIALAVLLLAGAGLLLKSFARLHAVDPGFNASNVLTMRLSLPWELYEGDASITFFDELRRRAATLPGVGAVATASQFPPLNSIQQEFSVAGRAPSRQMPAQLADLTVTSAGFLEALEIPLVKGRGFTEGDDRRAPFVALVNQSFARRFFPGEDPLGQRLGGDPDAPEPWRTVVGVVADVHNRGVDRAAAPEIYLPLMQSWGWQNQTFVLVRFRGAAGDILPLVRREILALDPNQPAYAIRTVEDTFDQSVAQQQIAMAAMGVFAVVALLLAASGVYGVVSYAVGQQTREIGVRIALGADKATVVRAVVGGGATFVAIGVAIGLVGAVAITRVLSSVLFEVNARDPAVLGAVGILLMSIALLAAYLPARRATRVDPVTALRSE